LIRTGAGHNRIKEKGLHKGELNSQFGTMWITNDVINKKINKNDVMPEGWHKGRILGC